MRKRASRGPRLWRAAARSCGRLEAVSSSTESSISGAPPPSRPPEGHGVVVAAYHGRLSRARLQGADLRWPSSKPRARRRRTTSPHSRKATWPTAPPNRSPGSPAPRRIAARQTIPAPALCGIGDRAQRQPRRTTPARLIVSRPHLGTRAKRKLRLARCAPPPCHWRGTPLGRCAADFRSPFPPSCTAVARPARVRDLILLSECGRSRRLTHW